MTNSLVYRRELSCFLEWSHEVVELCKEFRGQGVVAIDLANHEIPASAEDIAAFEVSMLVKI